MSKIKDILSIELENDIKNVIDLNSQNEDDIKMSWMVLSLRKVLLDICLIFLMYFVPI